MNHRVSVSQLQKNLPEILNRASVNDDVCVVESNGKGVAVIVSMREWQRHSIGERLDALGPEYRITPVEQRRVEALLLKDRLTKAEQKELDSLLVHADQIILRRAEAVERL